MASVLPPPSSPATLDATLDQELGKATGRIRLNDLIAGGLTLAHYPAFEVCGSLPALKERFAAEMPEHVRLGIHVMAAQNQLGEVVIGDSHEYDAAIGPFDKPEIDRLILNYLSTFFARDDIEITARWHGMYAKHPRDAFFIAHPAPAVTVVTGLGGAGMTLSFGLADEVVRSIER